MRGGQDGRETPSRDWLIEIYKAVRAHELLLNKATAEFEGAALRPLFVVKRFTRPALILRYLRDNRSTGATPFEDRTRLEIEV
jgi:hypothetical protein